MNCGCKGTKKISKTKKNQQKVAYIKKIMYLCTQICLRCVSKRQENLIKQINS